MNTLLRRVSPKIYLWPDGKNTGMVNLSRNALAFNTTKDLTGAAGSFSISAQAIRGKTSAATYHILSDLERNIMPNALVSIGVDRPGGIMLGLVNDISVDRTYASQGRYDITLSGSDLGKLLERESIMEALLNVTEQEKFYAALQDVLGPGSPMLAALTGLWGPQLQIRFDDVWGSGQYTGTTTGGTAADGTYAWSGVDPSVILVWALSLASSNVPALAALGGSGRLGGPDGVIKLDTSVGTTWFESKLTGDQPTSYTGSVWNFMKSILDEDVYELFLETLPIDISTVTRTMRMSNPEVPDVRLILRPKPFDEPGLAFLPTTKQTGNDWESLRTFVGQLSNHEIPIHEVTSNGLGVTDADVFSFIKVLSDNSIAGGPGDQGLYFPAVDTWKLARYGVRPYDAKLRLAAWGPTVDSGEVIEFRNRLLNWYRYSDYFQGGSINCAGRDDFRVGDPVLLPWMRAPRQPRFTNVSGATGMRYYCTGVTQNWKPGMFKSTLRLARGHSEETMARAKEDLQGYITPNAPNAIAEASVGDS